MGSVGALVSASTLQAGNPLRKRLRSNLEVEKERTPIVTISEMHTCVCVCEGGQCCGMSSTERCAQPGMPSPRKTACFATKEATTKFVSCSNLERDPCKGKLVRHGSEDYSKCMKFAWNSLNLPLQENSFPAS